MEKAELKFLAPERIEVAIKGVMRSASMRSRAQYTTWLALDALYEAGIPIPDGLNAALIGLVNFVEEHEDARKGANQVAKLVISHTEQLNYDEEVVAAIEYHGHGAPADIDFGWSIVGGQTERRVTITFHDTTPEEVMRLWIGLRDYFKLDGCAYLVLEGYAGCIKESPWHTAEFMNSTLEPRRGDDEVMD